MHALSYHVSIFIRDHNSFKQFTGQGVEKNNDDAKCIFFPEVKQMGCSKGCSTLRSKTAGTWSLWKGETKLWKKKKLILGYWNCWVTKEKNAFQWWCMWISKWRVCCQCYRSGNYKVWKYDSQTTCPRNQFTKFASERVVKTKEEPAYWHFNEQWVTVLATFSSTCDLLIMKNFLCWQNTGNGLPFVKLIPVLSKPFY